MEVLPLIKLVESDAIWETYLLNTLARRLASVICGANNIAFIWLKEGFQMHDKLYRNFAYLYIMIFLALWV